MQVVEATKKNPNYAKIIIIFFCWYILRYSRRREQIKLFSISNGFYKFTKLKNLKNKEIPDNISNLFVKKISNT